MVFSKLLIDDILTNLIIGIDYSVCLECERFLRHLNGQSVPTYTIPYLTGTTLRITTRHNNDNDNNNNDNDNNNNDDNDNNNNNNCLGVLHNCFGLV